MKRTQAGFFFSFALLFVCCTNNVRTTESLSIIESTIINAPDSALHLLQNIPDEWLNNRATRAHYALLYAEASDRAQVDSNNDSLLFSAWEYYRDRPHDIRNQCKTRYFQGRNKLRQGDKPGALRLFLDVE